MIAAGLDLFDRTLHTTHEAEVEMERQRLVLDDRKTTGRGH
jgi:hypothetical protein